ncbi:hypothetical protein ACFUEN_35220 [Streptomyces griseorubiginosus]|uniref:hypothetical protein n=1 Tax=Streptomyces griseorubiginosus TaxID=67304 RepID=UPI00363EBD12
MRRVLMAHFVPCALFVGCVYVLLRSGSFSGRGDWGSALPSDWSGTAGSVLLVGSGSAVLAMLLYPFQVRAVRVLEGYWDRWSLTAGVAGVLTEIQRRRRHALGDRVIVAADASPRAIRIAADAARRLAAVPPEEVLLPTALGNALRAGELSAGERYGLATLASWPRIHLHVSDRLAGALHSARTALDTAVNLCWSFLASAVVASTALYDEPVMLWLPLLALLLAALSYKGAVTAAQAYAGLMHIVYDLHRFDLLDALHFPLPDRADEAETFWQVSQWFTGSPTVDLPYDHGRRPPTFRGLSDTRDADGSADA